MSRHPSDYWPNPGSGQRLHAFPERHAPGQVGGAGGSGSVLPPRLAAGATVPAWAFPPAAAALIEVAREAQRTNDRLQSVGLASGLTATQVTELSGALWSNLRVLAVEAKRAGHRGTHAGCSFCEFVNEADDPRPDSRPDSRPAVEGQGVSGS